MIGVYTTETKLAPHEIPTRETYDALQNAYDHFNWALFENALPNCLITLQRKGRTYGYFGSQRFQRSDGTPCDEIALNPIHFKTRSDIETLSTLAHEMVHLWQAHFGSPGRGRYHNREWADKMKSIGLTPSNTGKPGGAELGDQMTHYILDGEVFDRAARELLDQGFALTWREEEPQFVVRMRRRSSASSITQTKSKAGKRVKYCCMECGVNAWSRHGAVLFCGLGHPPAQMSPA
ncbi:MAG: SprT-like domain-containing protein [Pseudomonadota bacterium]